MRKNPFVLVVFFLTISIFVFLLRDTAIVKISQGFVQDLFSTPREVLYGFDIHGSDDTTELKKENLELIKKLSEFEVLTLENEALRSQFETSGRVSPSLLQAKVLGFLGNRSVPNALIIDVGIDNEIKKGMGVVSDNFLVGKVKEVSSNYSVVITPLNTDFSTLVKIPSSSATGIIRGKDDFLFLERVIITDDIGKDDLVLTKGEIKEAGIGILPDIIVGKIRTIERAETDPFQTAEVEPIIDYSELDVVFIMKSI